ncbi:MAG TPA: iron ABC transporter permease [Caulobacteraceae bacterium]|nr:iron ABC transporter permease [Caulobacteraceae bacterium]
MTRLPRGALIAGLVAAVAALGALSLVAGRVWVPWSAWTSLGQDPRWAIVFGLRLPRTVLGVMVGAALGASGAALQGYVRNPLADPGILGVSTTAALGAVLTLYLGVSNDLPWVLPAAAILGAALGVALLVALAGVSSSAVTFILAGVTLNTVAGAGVALALTLAPSPWAVNEIINWLLGSLADRSVEEVRLAAPFIAAGLALLFCTGRALDALTLGDTGARALGIDMGRTRLVVATGVGLSVGAAVATTGVIGFVGLVTPHLLRPFVGNRPGALLVPSAVAGAAIVVAADIIVRLIPSQSEVRLGVAMAALGGPFFLALLISLRRRLT